jgi:phosphopantothenoylcysteine decarboxylase/phosphopantothenate--cysteine ligase
MADNLLTATLLASRAPLVLAPAMESHMWEHVATQDHIAALVERGALVVGPGTGRLASGAQGVGRMAEPSEIIAAVRRELAGNGPLAGCYVLVTAGGTQEPVDPVRFLTNASSGKMGVALAEAARDLGAEVTVVHAPLSVALPDGVECVAVRTAVEMRDAVVERLPETDILIGAAAVADYRPSEVARQKIKKNQDVTLKLVRNPDILAEVAVRRAQTGLPRFVIGFAAETQDLLTNAAAKLKSKNLDLIVANDVTQEGAGFGSDDNRVTLLYPDGRQEPLPILSKTEVAQRVLHATLRLMN